ncbi:MAG TPA: DUF4058 family protein [Pirellulales bacterium]|nr:DUF4058 family protein [Pirellulales bacterium]
MPSPFPGMDPYLEGDDWTSFHTHFATEIARQLTPRLRPKYVALPEKRFDVVDERAIAIEAIYPDVGVANVAPLEGEMIGQAVITAPCLLQTVMETPSPHTWVEIRDAAGRSLVTTIEILSPWNKRGAGRDEYLDKRRNLLRSSSHLIEIDLLRRGRRLPMKNPLPPASYYVFVCRAEQRPMMHVWPIGLDHPLPTVPVPLLAGDADVALDLQSCLRNIYDLGGFDLVLDYSKAAAVPLRGNQAAWAAERLRAAECEPLR